MSPAPHMEPPIERRRERMRIITSIRTKPVRPALTSLTRAAS